MTLVFPPAPVANLQSQCGGGHGSWFARTQTGSRSQARGRWPWGQAGSPQGRSVAQAPRERCLDTRVACCSAERARDFSGGRAGLRPRLLCQAPGRVRAGRNGRFAPDRDVRWSARQRDVAPPTTPSPLAEIPHRPQCAGRRPRGALLPGKYRSLCPHLHVICICTAGGGRRASELPLRKAPWEGPGSPAPSEADTHGGAAPDGLGGRYVECGHRECARASLQPGTGPVQ